MKNQSQKNYEFYLNVNLDKYIGEWVAICDNKIISHGKDVKKVYEESNKKCGGKRPLLTKVPEKETMIF